MEAYLRGLSTRKVDDLVKALGADTGISKSEVSRVCAGLDAEVAQFRDRTLSTLDCPYVFLDATYCKARVNHRITSQAIGTVFQGASWQRCPVHFMRNVLSVEPKGRQDMTASIIRTVVARPDLLAFAGFPQRHWRQT